MPKLDYGSKDEDVTQETAPDEATAPEVPAPAPAAPPDDSAPPSLEDAFYTLCTAMCGVLEDDNMVAWQHCQEIQVWYTNAGADAAGNGQKHLAWAHAIQILEQLLGSPLTQR
jgi:hypothetical protein